jgi:hypothetical protein
MIPLDICIKSAFDEVCATYPAQYAINDKPHTKWDNVKNKILVGKKIPFVPINHIGIFYNGHLFHFCSDILVEPSDSLRIVAYYNFKNLFLLDAAKRFGQSVVDLANDAIGLATDIAGAANAISNVQSAESLINLKDSSDIANITKRFNI